MRLTLRTLLAYLDEILEPKDAEEIGKKLGESEVASSLLHRIRDVMRRLRLKAPDVDEQDTALDPNTVAEYLDNTLQDDRVPDFEKVCLESDMHLAEVASCHQILAMVLGEPAEIDPKSREHMYTLRQVAAEQSEMEAAAAEAYDTDEQSPKPVRPPRPRPEIPDYLRDKPRKKRWLPLAVVLVLAGGLAAVLLAAGGQLEFLGIQSPFADKEVADSTLTEQQEQDSGKADETDTQAPADQSDAVKATDVTAEPDKETPAEKTTAVEQPMPPGAAEKQPAAEEKSPAIPPAAVSKLPPAQPPIESPAKTPAQSPPVKVPAETPAGAIQSLVPPGQPATDDTVLKQPGTQPPAVQPSPQPAPDDEMSKGGAAESDVPVPPQRIARFMSDNHILLRLDTEKQHWSRVPPQDILTPGHELLSLPTFKPVIAMTADLTTIRLVGGTRIAFEPINAEGVPGLKIDYGRAIIQPVGDKETRLAMTFGNQPEGQRKGELKFGEGASTLTIEVTHELATGRNPEDQAPGLKVTLGLITGQVQWIEENAEPVEIKASQQLMLSGFQPAEPEKPVAMESSPEWTSAGSVSLLERNTSATLEAELGRERSIDLALKELAEHRKKEVRRLAIGCLGHMGIYDQMVAVLNDPEQWLRRPDYINDLREALSRGPQVAAQVREAFQRQYGTDADGLYRLLWGFTDDQLQKEKADQMLVDTLDSSLLAARALGFWNLQNITGMGLYYKPDDIPIKRQQAIRHWRNRLKDGDIRHRKNTPRSRPPAAKEPSPAKKDSSAK
ncbi:MAG: hypothetical protein JXM70_06570 [Pirellulales bacterium]|nr:hypothetical protein [Pirellulales bacterium]